jgi:hypothetical protein
MKQRFESRIRELLDAEPDPEVIGEEVKKVMNSIYRQLKQQIKQENYYSGNGVLTGMLKIIKMYTLKVLQQQSNDDETEEKYDFFSQHIYLPESIGKSDEEESIKTKVYN